MATGKTISSLRLSRLQSTTDISTDMADDEKNCAPDVSKYDEDSVPPEEKEIKHTHPGRPDLDYDDTPVGPAEGAEPASDS